MKKGLKIMFFIGLICLPINIYAVSSTITIDCPSKASAGATVSCSLNISSSNTKINGVSASYDLSSGLSFSSFTPGSSWSQKLLNNSTGFSIGDVNGVSSGTLIGTLKLSLSSSASPSSSYNVDLDRVSVSDINYLDVATNVISDSIRVSSDDNKLSSLSLSNGTINFSPTVNVYNVTVNSSSTVISGSKSDSFATVSGLGTKSLKYGLNTFKVVVTAENLAKRTYTLNITRPDNRSNENRLTMLSVTGANIGFSPDVFKYNLSVSSSYSSVKISASLQDPKASFVKGYAPRTVSLKYGVNTFYIKTKSEKGTIKAYTLVVTRKDDRSSNNNLSALGLSNGSLSFNQSTLVYNVDVERNISSAVISATLQDSKSTFVSGYGPRSVNLKEGSNTFYVKVKSEKGIVKTYTLNINRKDGRSNNNFLKSLTLSEGTIAFDKNILVYDISVPYETEKLVVTAVGEDSKAKVNYDSENDLVVGINKIIIKVTAENNAVKSYLLNVTRKEKGLVLSNDSKLSTLVINGKNITLDSNNNSYTYKTNETKLNINATAKDSKANVSVSGNENLSDGSIIKILVTAEDGSTTTYLINIESASNMLMIILISFGVLVLAFIVLFIIKKNKPAKFNGDISADSLNTISSGYNSSYNEQGPIN